MSATNEALLERINHLTKSIDETRSRGEDSTTLEHELKTVREAFNRSVTLLNESAPKVIRG